MGLRGLVALFCICANLETSAAFSGIGPFLPLAPAKTATITAPSMRPKIDYGAGYDPRNRPALIADSEIRTDARPKIDYGAGYDPRNRPALIPDAGSCADAREDMHHGTPDAYETAQLDSGRNVRDFATVEFGGTKVRIKDTLSRGVFTLKFYLEEASLRKKDYSFSKYNPSNDAGF